MVSLKNLFFLVLSGALVFSCGTPKNDPVEQSPFADPVVVEMYDAAAKGDTAYIAKFADAKEAIYRMIYARLMASIQPNTAPEALEDLLIDPIPYVRLYSAFAVGQIGNQKSLPALEKALNKTTIPEIKAELLEAIGKCANGNAMEYLLAHNPNTAIEEGGKMWGFYQGMLLGHLKEDHLKVVVAHLESNEEETRLAAANILSRQKSFDLDTYSDEILAVALNEASNEVKAALGNALSKTDKAREFSENSLVNSDDPLIRNVALKALPNPEDHLATLENVLISESPWEAMIAVSRLSELSDYEPSTSIVAAARTTEIPEVRAFIAGALFKSSPEAGSEFYKESWTYFDNDVKRSVLLSVWAQIPSGIDTLKQYLFLDNPLGTGATMAYLEGVRVFPEWKTYFLAFADRALSEGLLAQTHLFVGAIAESDEETLISAEQLETALENFNSPNLVEGYIAISNLLKQKFDKDVAEMEIQYQKNDWGFFRNLGLKPKIVVYSGAEIIEIALIPEDAPVSCTRIAKLAADGFYDGTYFHRVVPGFVSQGGGPRGDGFGSGKDLLRSEFSPLKYGSGVVGLASAGMDTESCQFFFTHQPTPHLDGRYTIIGATDDDLSRLETGARIDSVRIKLGM
ncbi:MAG: peptidylprolyl isomerase [Flavobacteriales bacterium]|nr:peptidylprolyl isomerase [Flavobacteriales bacterium]